MPHKAIQDTLSLIYPVDIKVISFHRYHFSWTKSRLEAAGDINIAIFIDRSSPWARLITIPFRPSTNP